MWSNSATTVGPQEHRVGQAERVRVGVRQALDQPDHVVAHVAEQAGRHQRQAVRQVDRGSRRSAGAGCPAPARRRARTRRGRSARARLISARVAAAAPDQVGLDAQDRVAAAHRAAGRRSRAGSCRAGRRRASASPRPASRGRRPARPRPPAPGPPRRPAAKCLEVGSRVHAQRCPRAGHCDFCSMSCASDRLVDRNRVALPQRRLVGAQQLGAQRIRRCAVWVALSICVVDRRRHHLVDRHDRRAAGHLDHAGRDLARRRSRTAPRSRLGSAPAARRRRCAAPAPPRPAAYRRWSWASLRQRATGSLTCGRSSSARALARFCCSSARHACRDLVPDLGQRPLAGRLDARPPGT